MVQATTGTELRNEVRLGLVLYGGVSLAIYINGVAREFWNIVKGQGPYRLLKGLIDADVVVDIVSGTSAGGINGVLLSYALANGRDFKHCAELWREHADFGRMLRPVDAKNPPSVLDGEGYFRDRLVDMYRGMPPWTPPAKDRKGDSLEGKWESRLEALDLFVTGTDYDGEVSTRVDGLGHAISIKDHRKVFKLKYRLDRANDFKTRWDDTARPPRTRDTDDDEARVRALATISRCTSSFPGAFPPTVVQEEATPPAPAGDRDAGADRLVRLWGAFKKRTNFLDGGVLDNKPFTYTIRDIYLRTAERRVVRKLFYVEPDPEHLDPERRPSNPNILGVVLSSLVGIPGYESIAEDLREIDGRNARLLRYEEVTSILREKRHTALGAAGNTDGPKAAVALSPSSTQQAIHFKSRAAQMRDRFVDGIRTSATWSEPGGTARIAALAAEVVTQFDALDEDRRQDLLDRYDVDYAMRRLFYVTYELYDRLYTQAKGTEEPPRRLINLLAALNREIQVLKVLQYAVERFRDALSKLPASLGSATDLWTRVHGMLDFLLAWPVRVETGGGARDWSTGPNLPSPDDATGWAKWLPDSDIKHLHDALVGRLDEITKRLEGKQPFPEVGTTVATTIEALEDDTERILAHFFGPKDRAGSLGLDDRAIRAAWGAFDEIDAYLFPLEYLSDLQEKDRIEVVRVSPIDARLGFGGTRPPADKIAGDTLFHFGGFFKRSWRSNDILWGRLDALDLLFESLLKREHVSALVEAPARREHVKRYLTGGGDPAGFDARAVVEEIFPCSAPSVKDRIAAWLGQLLATPGGPSGSTDPAEAALETFEKDGMREILVRAGQLEILEKDLPDVIQDAVDESVEWGTTKRPARAGAGDGFERLDVDSLVGAIIKEMASQVIRPRPVSPPASAPPDPATDASLGARMAAPLGTAYRGLMRMVGFAAPAPARPRLIQDVGEFFEHGYHVGGEDIRRDIPPVILVQTFAHALIVAKNALFGALQGRHVPRPGLARALVRWALEYPLWMAYALASLIRRQPNLTAMNAVVLLTAIVALTVGVIWREAIWWIPKNNAHQIQLIPAAVLIVLPVLALVVQALWLRWWLLARSAFDRRILPVRFLISGGAVALVVWGWFRGQYVPWLEGIGRVTHRVLGDPAFYWFAVLPAGLFLISLALRLSWRRRKGPE